MDSISIDSGKARREAMGRIGISLLVLGLLLASCFHSVRPAKVRSDVDGFRGMKWGTEITSLTDMEMIEQLGSPESDLAWYIRKGDPLTLGRAKLEKISYAFWEGGLESVWIDFKGDENWEALRKELFEQFGEVLESEELLKRVDKKARGDSSTIDHPEMFYAWGGKNTDISLFYSKQSHKGNLSFISKKISEERRTYERERQKKN